MFTEYGELSTKMYELTKPVGHSINGDLEYYYECLKEFDRKILEAGVGTGRMMIPFIQKGLKVEGVDLSAEMLKQARKNMKKAQVQGVLYQGDLTNLKLEDSYQAIVMPTGSFCLLPRAKVTKILQSFNQHLEAGGQLIIDLELPSEFKEKEVVCEQYQIDDETGILFTSMSQRINWQQQKTSYIHRYDFVRKGYVEKTEISNFVLYWYGLAEFTALLEKNGFSSVKWEAGYGKDQESSVVTFFASK